MGKKRRTETKKTGEKTKSTVVDIIPSTGVQAEHTETTPVLWKKIITSVIVALLVFPFLSYSITLYIFVPIISAFLVTLIVPERKNWWILPVATATLGSIIYAWPPHLAGPLLSFEQIILGIIAEHQAELLWFKPPLLGVFLVLFGLLGGLLGWGIATLLRRRPRLLPVAGLVLFILLCINMAILSIDMNPQTLRLATREPVAGEYNNYNSVYLKTFYLMKKGHGFYDAYTQAYASRAASRDQKVPGIGIWRSPVVFYLWKLLLPADGFYIFYLYLLLNFVALYLLYDLARSHLPPPMNILPVIAVSYLFLYGGVAFWFAFPEFWSAPFLMLALWGLYKENKWAVVAGFSAAILINPLAILLWLSAAIILMVSKERRRYLPILIPGIILILPIINYWHIFSRDFQGSSLNLEVFHGSFVHMLETLTFGAVMLSKPLLSLAVTLLLFIIALLFMKKTPVDRALMAMALTPPILFLKVGPITYRDYWGIVYLPFLLIAACFVISILEKFEGIPREEEKGIEAPSGESEGEIILSEGVTEG